MGRRPRCFTLVFPLELVFPDGATVELADRRELLETSRNGKAENPDAEDRPSLAFPYEVTLADGTVATISNEDDQAALLSDCRADRPDLPVLEIRPCIKLIYPVEIAFPDGSTAEAGDRRATLNLLIRWREENPDAESRPELVYPVEVELRDGAIEMVNSAEEFAALREGCPGRRAGRILLGVRDCFRVQFPLAFELPSGRTIRVANRSELRRFLHRRNSGPRPSRRHPQLVFPIEIKFEEGQTAKIEDEDALREAIASCVEGDE